MPINRLLSLHTDALRHLKVEGVLTAAAHPADACAIFLDLLRRWLIRRGIPWAAVWVRERSRDGGEHLHVGFHLAGRHDRALVLQLAAWTGAPDFEWEPSPSRTGSPARVIARECGRLWDLSGCSCGGTTGTTIAAYLGKGEPNEVLFRGRLRRNRRKARPRYWASGGEIEGTAARHCRWGISRSLRGVSA